MIIIIGPWFIFHLVSQYNRWELVKYKKRFLKIQKLKIKIFKFNQLRYNDFYKKGNIYENYHNICIYRIINFKI